MDKVAKKKAEEKRALAEDRRRQAAIAKAPLPKQFGLPTNPITGDVLTSADFIEESPMFHDEQRDERVPAPGQEILIGPANGPCEQAIGYRTAIDEQILVLGRIPVEGGQTRMTG